MNTKIETDFNSRASVKRDNKKRQIVSRGNRFELIQYQEKSVDFGIKIPQKIQCSADWDVLLNLLKKKKKLICDFLKENKKNKRKWKRKLSEQNEKFTKIRENVQEIFIVANT